MNAHFLFDVFQFLVVAALVMGCGVYCCSRSPRHRQTTVETAVAALPLPAFVTARLRQPTPLALVVRVAAPAIRRRHSTGNKVASPQALKARDHSTTQWLSTAMAPGHLRKPGAIAGCQRPPRAAPAEHPAAASPVPTGPMPHLLQVRNHDQISRRFWRPLQSHVGALATQHKPTLRPGGNISCIATACGQHRWCQQLVTVPHRQHRRLLRSIRSSCSFCRAMPRRGLLFLTHRHQVADDSRPGAHPSRWSFKRHDQSLTVTGSSRTSDESIKCRSRFLSPSARRMPPLATISAPVASTSNWCAPHVRAPLRDLAQTARSRTPTQPWPDRGCLGGVEHSPSDWADMTVQCAPLGLAVHSLPLDNCPCASQRSTTAPDGCHGDKATARLCQKAWARVGTGTADRTSTSPADQSTCNRPRNHSDAGPAAPGSGQCE